MCKALQGLKVRVSPDPVIVDALAALGAQPIALSFLDVASHLDAGNLDAVLTSAEAGVNARLWRHFKTFTS
ncbi:MAG: hypothetical protein R3E60_03495 [Alphaproteobacteria bacterium]